jgi:CHAT domain-containing protein
LIFLFFQFISIQVFSELTDKNIEKHLDQLRKEDNLLEWIDLRVNYSLENPVQRLPFLLSTQKETWRTLKSIQEKEAWLYLLINQSYYQLYTGDILGSIEKYEEAWQFQLANEINSLDEEEYILKPLSNNYTRIGDYEKAIFIQNKSLALALSKKNNTLAASICNNLAISYRYKKDLSRAESITKKGIQLLNNNQQHTIYAQLLATLSEIKFEQKQLEQAEKLVNEAAQILTKQSKNKEIYYILLSSYTLLGNISFNKNDLDKAEKSYNKALEIIYLNFKGERKRELAHLLSQKGKIALSKNQAVKAIEFFNNGLTTLIPDLKIKNSKDLPLENQLFSENRLQHLLEGKAKALLLLGDKQTALKSYLLAFDTSEKLRTEFTYEASKVQLQEDIKLLAEQVIETAYHLWLETENVEYAKIILSFSEKTKARILLDQLAENQLKIAESDNNSIYQQKINIERAIYYHERQFREKQNQSSLKQIEELKFTLSGIQKKTKEDQSSPIFNADKLLTSIPEQTTAVIYFFGAKNIYLIEAEKNKIHQILKIKDSKEIKVKINDYLSRYFYNGPSSMTNKPREFYQRSYEIYETLLSQIKLNNLKKTLIIRDDVLNLLSFDGLITNNTYTSKIKKWPFLIYKTPISYSYSLNSRQEIKEQNLINTGKFTGFFISHDEVSRKAIPAVEKEYQFIKSNFKGSFLENKNANLNAFRNSIENSNILHISTHASVSDSLKEPTLELYKENFYLFELSIFKRIPDLVVLSACQTADGKLLSGEGVMSLSRGFSAAGAKGVLSGLWKINDDVTANLMHSFYNLLAEHRNPEKALREAKLNWIQNTNTNKIMVLPYYWDSLIYVGKTQEIHLEKTFPHKWKTVFMASVILILVLFYLRKFKKINKQHLPSNLCKEHQPNA